MDGFAFDYVPPAADAVQRVAPFVPPVCVSPLSAQALAIALVILVVLALQGGFSSAKGPRR